MSGETSALDMADALKVREDRGKRRTGPTLAAAGFAVPVLAYFWLIQHYGVNAIWYDQWDDIRVIVHPTLSNLWLQHNEDRIFFPNLIVLALAHTTHFDTHVEELLSGVFLVAAIGLIVLAHRRRDPQTPWLYYCPVPFLMLSFAQWWNTLFGFQLAWYMDMLAFAAAIFLIDRHELHWGTMAGAIAVSVIGSFSSLQGLLIWPAGLVLLHSRKRSKGFFLAWIASGICCALVYFHNYSSSVAGSNNSFVFAHPMRALEFYLSLMGDVVGETLPVVSHNYAVMALGAVIVVAALGAIVARGFRRDDTPAAIGVTFVLFGLAFAAIVAAGRTQYGLFYADASRYTTFDLLVLVGTYLVVISPRASVVDGPVESGASEARLRSSSTEPSPTRWPWWGRFGTMHVLRGTVICLVILVLILGTENGFSETVTWNKKMNDASQVAVNIERAPDDVVTSVLYPSPVDHAAFVRKMAQLARRHDLSVFSTGAGARLEKLGLPSESDLETRVLAPANGAKLKGKVLLVASGSFDIGPIQTRVGKLQFEITNRSSERFPVAPPGLSIYGWIGGWNTASVPNGTYELRSVAYDTFGRPAYSNWVHVTVDNRS
ncbi:MAG: hypothetical protein ACRDV4_02335 [Acidimicrobiales bacterium]